MALDSTLPPTVDSAAGESPLGLPTGTPPSGRATAPPVLRVRIAFSKGAGIRFISHLDLVRLWERAMRRAQLPLAYTHGFTPHPRLTFAAPLALGVTADRELMDALFTERLGLDELRDRLAAQLPPACRVVDLQTVALDAAPLMAALRWAEYRVLCSESLPAQDGEADRTAVPAQGSRWSRQSDAGPELPTEDELAALAVTSEPWRPAADRLPPLSDPVPLPPVAEVQRRIDTLLAAEHIPHTRHRDGKTTTHDLRPLLLDLWLADSSLITQHSALVLGMLLRADSSGAGRPDEIAAVLGLHPRRIHRLRLGLDEK